jgi:SAM-dependent methyltransferase
MATFSDFDTRGYRMVDARTGYGEWATTYERTVEDAMDVELLDRLESPPWATIRVAADLGCGTGRTGAWLKRRGVRAIDGVDLTTEMLAVAREKGAHRRLVEADVRSTPLESGAYDLAISSLVDEHLPDVRPLYHEAFRLVKPGGHFVIVAYHPQFIMVSGMPTHFRNRAGEEVAIATHLHLLSDRVTAGLSEGGALIEMKERLIDDTWVQLKPKWERLRNHPISVAFVWQKPAVG